MLWAFCPTVGPIGRARDPDSRLTSHTTGVHCGRRLVRVDRVSGSSNSGASARSGVRAAMPGRADFP